MAGLVPFNYRNGEPMHSGSDFDNFYNLLDDFFSDGFTPTRNLLRDTFKIDIQETENEYLVEAELPGIKKDEIDISADDENLCVSVNRVEETNAGNKKDGKNFIHKERRATSMSRRVRLIGAKLDEIKAKLKDGILQITIPKDMKTNTTRKINIEE
jgi:HSP20 family protein